MRAQVTILPLQGGFNQTLSTSPRLYEAMDPIAGTARWVVGMVKDANVHNWFFDFIVPSFALNNANSQLKIRWVSPDATSGSPFLHLLKLNFTTNTNALIPTATTTASVSGITYLGAGKVHETVLRFLGANSLIAGQYIAFRLQRSNNVGDTLDGTVEVLNVVYEFDTDNTQKKQFIWVPNEAMRSHPLTGFDKIYRDYITIGASPNNDSWPYLRQDANNYTYAIASMITPAHFQGPINVLTAFRTGSTTNAKNLYKISACTLPLGTIVASSDLPFTYEVTNVYTESLTTATIQVYNNALTGFVDGGNRQLFLRIARQGDDATDSNLPSYIIGSLIEWSTGKLLTSIGLLSSTAAITASGYAATIKITDTDTYVDRNWLSFNPIGTGGATINFAMPDNYESNGRFRIYYTSRTRSTTGYALLQLSLSIVATGSLVDSPISASGILIQLTPGGLSGGMLEYIDTTLPTQLVAGATAKLKIVRYGDLDTLEYPIDISEILLEYRPLVV